MILKGHIAEVVFPKNHILISSDKIEKDLYFIKKGIARTFVFNDGDESTFSFGKEGDTIISFNSYIDGEKDVRCISDSFILSDLTFPIFHFSDVSGALICKIRDNR